MEKKDFSKDLELVSQCKGGSEAARIELFNKYKPLIHRYHSALYAKSPSWTKEDTEQEAYMAIEKAVSWISLDKISNPESWGFYATYSMFLKSMVTHLAKFSNIFSKVPEASLEELSIDIDGTKDAYNYDIPDSRFSSPTESIFNEIDIKEFRKRLDESEKRLFNLFIEHGYRVDNKTASEILNRSERWISRRLYTIREKYESYKKT